VARELWEPWKANGSTLEHLFREHNTAADALASDAAAGRPLDGSRTLWIPHNIPDLQQEALNNSGEWNVYSQGTWKPFSIKGKFVVRLARLAAQRVQYVTPARWKDTPAAKGLSW
jgi:hypothetical protein